MTSPGTAVGMTALGFKLVVAVAAALGLLLIGRVLARLFQIRGLLAAALAPALTLAVAGIGAMVSNALGMRWGLAAMAASAISSMLILVGLRQLLTPHRQRDDGLWAQPAGKIAARPHRLWHGAMVLLAALPYVDGMRGGMYVQRWDMLFHTSALQQIEATGNASSLSLGSVAFGDGQAAFYPGAWHAFASLLPGVALPQLTAAMLVLCAVGWVLGIGALTQTLTDSVPVLRIATLGAAVVVASPLSLAIGWGHIPNAVGFAALPALVAVGIRIIQDAPGNLRAHILPLLGLVSAGVGVALCHPNAALAALALLLVPAFMQAWRLTRSRGLWPALATMVAGAILVVTAVMLLGRSPLVATVSDFDGHTVLGVWQGIGQAVSGLYELWANAATAVFTIGATVGAVFAGRRKNYLPAGLLLVAWVLYVDAAAGSPLGLGSFWYSSPARLSVVVAMIALPLAAMGYHEIWQRWLQPWLQRIPGGANAVIVPIGLVLLVGLIGHSWGYRQANTARVAELSNTAAPRFVSESEWDMIASLPQSLPEPGSILGSPFSGAASVYGLTGVEVVFPVANQVLSDAQQKILAAAEQRDLMSACDALESLNVRYLYVDETPYQYDHRYRHLDLAVPSDSQVVASADSARVYLLAPCP